MLAKANGLWDNSFTGIELESLKMFDVSDEFVFEGVWYTVVEVEFDGYHVVDPEGNERFILECNL